LLLSLLSLNVRIVLTICLDVLHRLCMLEVIACLGETIGLKLRLITWSDLDAITVDIIVYVNALDIIYIYAVYCACTHKRYYTIN
jgi:hypothetical protein